MTVDSTAELLDGFRSVTATLAAAGRASAAADGPDRPDNPAGPRTPVTVLTGFLGSGKTTVLRHLLAADHGLSLTAIVNDLGAVNIDAALLGAAHPGEPIELSNGCACCLMDGRFRDSLVLAAGRKPQPDAIVIEASGAADVIALAATVESEPELQLDGIVCIVDATSWMEQVSHPSLGRLARRQIEASHLVLLSKIDLVAGAVTEAVTASIAETAPGRRVVPVKHGAVEPSLVLGAALLGASLPPAVATHDSPVIGRTIRLDEPIDRASLAEWLERGEHGLLRAKGWFEGDANDFFELQVVGPRWTMTAASADRPRSVVLIGTDTACLEAAADALGAMRSGPLAG